MSDQPEDRLSDDDELLIAELEAEIAGQPVDLRAERKLRDQAAYYALINHALARGHPAVTAHYLALRTRSSRLLRLLDLDAPRSLIARERGLVAEALTAIDPLWHGEHLYLGAETDSRPSNVGRNFRQRLPTLTPDAALPGGAVGCGCCGRSRRPVPGHWRGNAHAPAGCGKPGTGRSTPAFIALMRR